MYHYFLFCQGQKIGFLKKIGENFSFGAWHEKKNGGTLIKYNEKDYYQHYYTSRASVFAETHCSVVWLIK